MCKRLHTADYVPTQTLNAHIRTGMHTFVHAHTQTDRQTDRQTHAHTQTDRQTDRQTHVHTHRQTHAHTLVASRVTIPMPLLSFKLTASERLFLLKVSTEGRPTLATLTTVAPKSEGGM